MLLLPTNHTEAGFTSAGPLYFVYLFVAGVHLLFPGIIYFFSDMFARTHWCIDKINDQKNQKQTDGCQRGGRLGGLVENGEGIEKSRLAVTK